MESAQDTIEQSGTAPSLVFTRKYLIYNVIVTGGADMSCLARVRVTPGSPPFRFLHIFHESKIDARLERCSNPTPADVP